MEQFPPPGGVSPGNVWPPPPTSAVDDGRSRLLSMLANYASTAALARWVNGVQIVMILMESAIILGWLSSQSLGDRISGYSLAPSFIQSILYIIWTYCLYKNTVMLGVPGLRYSPGSVVAFQLIPVANFFVPYLILREVWQATSTDRELEDAGGDRRRTRVTPFLNVWWTLFAVVIITAGFSVYYAFTAGPNHQVSVIAEIGSVAYRILSVFVVLHFTQRQDARYAETLKNLTPTPTATQWPPN